MAVLFLRVVGLLVACLATARGMRAGGSFAHSRAHAPTVSAVASVRAAPAPASTMALNANSDWFSTTALVAESFIAAPAPSEDELAEVVEALDVAVRAHKQLKRKLASRLARLRMDRPSYYLMDGLDH
ncbi:hypothetical protein KFE25_007658 [Diacronema lutheri]|uniref:Uncharacterized protein n=1 Tax=Diacronema lutheri TaxID=2081491 RepID=A0A8J5XWB2_DIALT|nr:hypothetical protein KFE25_007658 [Diacronema lutheri]